MNVRIFRHRDHGCCILDLDQSAKCRIRQLGREVQRILAGQDQDLWRRASNPDLLARLLGAAIILQRIGLPNEQTAMLADDSAGLALNACIATALFAADLEPELLQILKKTLLLLALCCPVEVTLESLPPLGSLPEGFRTSEAIRQQYLAFAKSADCPREVALAEALVLLRIYQLGKRPEDAAVVKELLKTTEGLRTALRQLRKASQLNGKGTT